MLSIFGRLRRNPLGHEYFPGTTFVDDQFIDVNFAWLALPIALWVIVTILLVSTIWHTVRMRLPSWKTSSLPYLESQVVGNRIRTRNDMKKSAKDSSTQLKATTLAWHLERAK